MSQGNNETVHMSARILLPFEQQLLATILLSIIKNFCLKFTNMLSSMSDIVIIHMNKNLVPL